MSHRKLLIQTIVLTVIVIVAIAVTIIIVDPYQRYRANTKYAGVQRYEIAGVAANHDYDAVITGSSMAMNHYPKQIDSLWGWKSKNLSIMGATDDDYSVILPYIISQHKAKNIIIDIDNFSFARRRGAVPEYLYDDNIFNDYKYLWNYTSLKDAIGMLLGKGQAEDNLYHFNSPFGLNELINDFNHKLKYGYEGETFDLASMKARFDESLLPAIRQSPEINWYIYFPPYSIGEFIIHDIHGNLDSNLEFREYVAEKVSGMNNVSLYDFQIDPITTDLNSYMDLRHHSHAINKKIMQSIHDDEFHADKNVVIKNNKRIKELIQQYKDTFLIESKK